MSEAAKVVIAIWISVAVVGVAFAASEAVKHDSEARKAEAIARACSCPDGGAN